MGRSGRPNVACIGAGAWGRNIVRNLSELDALGWICETSAEAVEQLGEAYPDVEITGSVDEILGNPAVEAVAIATPAATHGDLVRRSLLAGKDVFVEKPLCLSVGEGQELVELAEREGRVLMVGHLLWYHPAVLRLKELVDEGALGRIQYIYSNRLNLGRIRREENILWSFAPHDVSVILGLLGESPSGIEARGGAYLSADVADVTVSILQFASGVKAHIFVSWLHPFKEQKLVVVGDKKMAVFDDTEPEDKLRLYPYSIEWKERFPTPKRGDAEPVAIEAAEPLRAEFEHFLHCVAERETPRTDGHEALRVLSVLSACQDHLEAAAPAALAPVQPGAEISAADAPEPNASANGRDYFVHETAAVDEGVEIGEGTKIWHFSHVLGNTRIGAGCSLGQNVMAGPNVTIGDRVKIQNNVSVYDGVTLEDDVFVGPSAVFTNVYNPRSAVPRMDELRQTLVRRGASLGANCTVVCGITIGRSAFIGAGAVVLRDVPDYGLIVGNPGRLAGWMCACGERITFPEDGPTGLCGACGSSYQKTGAGIDPADAPATSEVAS